MNINVKGKEYKVEFSFGAAECKEIVQKMFEYMSIGLPFITSDFPLYKNVAEKHQCGVCVNPSSPSEIAADLEKMINDPAKRELMSKNAIKAAEEHFDWKHEELKLHELYNTLLTR